METELLLKDVTNKLVQATEHFENELKKLRTGRGHPSMLDGVIVEVYGTQIPLIQVATIAVPEAQLLQVTPFDPGTLQQVASAIRNSSNLGFNPTDDGHVIRIPIPALTEERRKELAKQIGQKMEEALITMRTARHEALKDAEQSKKDKEISEDEFKRLQRQIDESMAKQHHELQMHAGAKEREVMTV
jgi:ribosome recycling factor